MMNRDSKRAAISVLAVAGVLATCKPVGAQPTSFPSRPAALAANPMAEYVAEASMRFRIPEAWIRSVMRVESGGEVGATSSVGAMGLMQVMPDTYREMRTQLGLGANAYDPHDNIIAGAAYLRAMHDRYGDAGFLAAYNAGPVRYEEFLAGARPLPSETILYIARLGPMLGLGGDQTPANNPQSIMLTSEGAPIFVSLHGNPRTGGVGANSAPPVNVAALDMPADAQTGGLFTSQSVSRDSVSTATRPASSPPTQMPTRGTSTPNLLPPLDAANDIFVRRSTTPRSP